MLSFACTTLMSTSADVPLPLVPLLSMREVGDLLGVSKDSVERMVKRGEFAVVRVGVQLRVHPSEVARYISERTTPRRT